MVPFPPVAIPMDYIGCVGDAETAPEAHYATFVYDIQGNEFCLFEFNKQICEGMMAYKTRYEKMSRLEILLSRYKDGSLKMTIGNNHVQKQIVPKEDYDLFSNFHDKLHNRYLNKKGYKLSDT